MLFARWNLNNTRTTPWLLSGLVLLLGFAISLYFYFSEQAGRRDTLRTALESGADQIDSNIEQRLRSFEIVMRGVQGLFLGSQDVGHEEFRNYVDSLRIPEQISGVQAVAFAEILSAPDITAHEQLMRERLSADYRVHPPGQRERLAVITYIEPLEENLAALGYDILTVPQVREATQQTLIDNDMAITAPLTLIQDAGEIDDSSFVMYLPVYVSGADITTQAEREAAIFGWVDVPFRMNDLIAGMQGEFNPDIVLQIFDGEPAPDAQLYHSAHQEIGSLQTRKELEIGGRRWTLLMNTSPAFEASIPGQQQGTLIITTGITLSAALALLVWVITNARYSAEARFRRLFTRAGDGILLFDKQHRCINSNSAARKLLGFNQKEMQQLPLSSLLAEGNSVELLQLNTLNPGTQLLAEWQLATKRGRHFPAEVRASRLDGAHYFLVMRDLTTQKLAQIRIHRLTQLYKALSATNHSVVRRGTEDTLFHDVCQIAVDFGGMQMAWIGVLDLRTEQVRVAAAQGTGLDYLDSLHVSADPDTPEGQGPSGIALRENRAVIIRDYQRDPSTAPWHALATEFGWHSAAAFPVQRGGVPYAVLNVYHSQADIFDQEAIGLLQEMASDVSFALDNLDRERERQLSRKALEENEAKMALVLDNVDAYIYLKDTQGRYLYANPHVLDLWGVSSEEVIGFTDEKFFDEPTLRQINANDRRVLELGETIRQEERNTVAGGKDQTVFWSVKLPLKRADGSIFGLCGISTDITERTRMENSLKLHARVFESSRDGIEITDSDNRIMAVNEAYTKITGYSEKEAIGQNPGFIKSGQLTPDFYQRMWQEIKTNDYWEGEVINRRKNGEAYPQWLSVTVVRDQQGEVSNHIGILTDLSEHKAREEHIRFLSDYDALTRLPNRKLLQDHARLALARARKSEITAALFFIDLDRFKIVNESLGPRIGDMLLKSVALRLDEFISPEQTLCRQGGDDFILLIPESNADHAAHYARELLQLLAQPYSIQEHTLVLTASIGIALYPTDARDFDQLAQNADVALFRAKKAGPNSFQFFTRQMHEHVTSIMQTEHELRQALAQNQLTLHYQIQVNAVTRAITGAEALIRWQHPLRGLIPPIDFIPIAEETGLIIDIGNWVMKEATRQIREWKQQGLPVVPVAVNLSAVQFRLPDFYDSVAAILEESMVEPHLLELELTERIAMEDSERTIEMLEKFHQLGVSLSIDDFGMGYSSLGYLKRFRVNTLKIDQSFVQGLGKDTEDEAIVNAIIGMARGLGFRTLAEGVETEEQLAYLKTRDCDEIQGYLIARPLPAEEFARLLSADRSLNVSTEKS